MVNFIKGISGFVLIVAGVAVYSWRAAIIAAGALLIFDNVTE